MNHVSLFSGYGGLDLGLKMAIPNLRTVLYCEYDRYAQGVLISRMRDGGLDTAPIWTDVRTLNGKCWRGCVDIISGGFPCQDVSVAGKRAGVVEGNRSGLWFQYARLIDEIRPSFAFIENVAGLVSNGFDRVLCDLTEMGYDTEWGVVSAASAGANHRRERVWCLAWNPNSNPQGSLWKIWGGSKAKSCGGGDVANADREHDIRRWQSQLTNGEGWATRSELEGVCADVSNSSVIHAQRLNNGQGKMEFGRSDWWQVEPAVGRVVDGCEYRVDKLRLLGNGVVPQQAALAFQILSERIIT